MKFFRNRAMTASLVCAGSSAQAQQFQPYAAPATLPAPAAAARQLWHQESVPALAPNPTYNGQDAAAPEQVAAPNNGHASPDYDAAMSGPCNDGACGDFGCCCEGYGMWTGPNPCCGPKWYGSVGGLIMTRNKPNAYQLSYDTTNPVGQLILNVDTVGEWQPGAEIKVGRYLGCSNAVEFGFWTLGNFEETVYAYDPPGVGSLNTPLDFRSLGFDIGGVLVPVTDFYDNAEAHVLSRRDEMQSLEMNFINWPTAGMCGNRMQLSWLAGLRYFHFREGFLFGTSDAEAEFGVDPANEAYLDIDVNNSLFGFQVGGKGELFVSRGLSLYATPKFGVYHNHMTQHTQIYTGDGIYALDSQSSRDTVSFVGQLDLGVNYAFSNCLSRYVGYRMMAVSGIALSDAQIPYLQDDLFGYQDIDHNSNLVLHGGMAGVQLRY